MRFLVELFDKEPIDNVLSPCIFQPEIVVYLCDERDATLFKESAIYQLFRRRKMKTRPRFYYFDATNPEAIRQVFMAVVRDYPGCVFDYSGGKDLVLLVAGMLTYERNLPGFYIDLPRGNFVNVRGCEHLKYRFAMPCFSVEDILAITGATIHGYGHFPLSEMNAAFAKDVLAVFALIQCNPKAWAEFVAWMQTCAAGSAANELSIGGPKEVFGSESIARANLAIIKHLKECGVLLDYMAHNHRVDVTFKSPLHKKCLLNQGIWLELYCYVIAQSTGFFDDVRTSVVVDWAGVEGAPNGTKNEVDVLLVKGVVPVFVSCKMGPPSPLALSEIKMLSVKFGGGQSRAVLLTATVLGEEYVSLKTRATDLGILLLDGTVLRHEQLAERLCEAVCKVPGIVPKLRPKPPKEDY